jgi:cytochrome P450 family 2 subfamily J
VLLIIDAQLYYSVVGLFGGGTETTTTTLLWAMIFMIENPKVQEKVREEIESVVAWEQPVTIQHKGRTASAHPDGKW